MFVKDEDLFNNYAFILNKNPQIHNVNTKRANINIIDNFYEDGDLVLKQIEKLPMAKIWKRGYKDNGKWFFDARKSYVTNMQGTEIPYSIDGSLTKLVSDIIEYPQESIEPDRQLIVNCFQFSDDLDLSNDYYSIHEDSYNAPGQVALVVFLNKYYEEGEGLNFYSALQPNDPRFYTTNSLIKKDEIELIYTVQAKHNRAVLFDSMFTHGQYTPTDQFKSEMRYTQAIFLPLL